MIHDLFKTPVNVQLLEELSASTSTANSESCHELFVFVFSLSAPVSADHCAFEIDMILRYQVSVKALSDKRCGNLPLLTRRVSYFGSCR